jgi:hypothetical protein
MQKSPLVLHKWGENIRNLPLRIRTNCIVCAMESACRGIKLRGWPVVRWPSVWSPMAIGVAPKWPSVSGPMAIHLESDGHRTGVGTPFSASHSRQTLVRGAFLVCRFPDFQEFCLPLPLGVQRLTWRRDIKNRVFPCFASLARKYAILAH